MTPLRSSHDCAAWLRCLQSAATLVGPREFAQPGLKHQTARERVSTSAAVAVDVADELYAAFRERCAKVEPKCVRCDNDGNPCCMCGADGETVVPCDPKTGEVIEVAAP